MNAVVQAIEETARQARRQQKAKREAEQAQASRIAALEASIKGRLNNGKQDREKATPAGPPRLQELGRAAEAMPAYEGNSAGAEAAMSGAGTSGAAASAAPHATNSVLEENAPNEARRGQVGLGFTCPCDQAAL